MPCSMDRFMDSYGRFLFMPERKGVRSRAFSVVRPKKAFWVKSAYQTVSTYLTSYRSSHRHSPEGGAIL